MPKGGLRPGAGRPPQENSRAKDRAAAKAAKAAKAGMLVVSDGDWLTLAPEGRSGNPPAWPLTTATAREREIWKRLWKTPQALGWERVGATEQVAMYVRTLVRAEDSESPIGLTSLVIRYQHDLGLTAVGLRMLHWRIGRAGQQTAASADTTGTAPAARLVSPKERFGLKVVPGGS